MSDTARSDESDLAYLKRLAQAGRGEPAPFLLLMAVFGGVYGFLLLTLIVSFLIEGPPTPGVAPQGPISSFLGRWSFPGAHLAFLAAVVWTIWRTVGPHRISLNRAASAIWSAAFVGLVTTWVAISLFTRNEPPTDVVYAAHFVGPVLLTLWGCAWWASAIASDRRWLLTVAIGSFAAAIALAWVGNTIMALPIMCASLIFLAFAPAVLLMRGRAA
jgi:hypothetical protein